MTTFTSKTIYKNKTLALIFGLMLMLLSNSMQAQLLVIGSSPFQDSIWAIDTTNLVVKYKFGPNLPGFTVTGMNGLCFDQSTGNYYCIAKVSAVSGRVLCSLDIHTMTLSQIGNLGDNFASITCTPQGTLFGATGDGATVPESFYRIDKTNGAKTLKFGMGNGADGEIITYNYDDNKIYHWSGNGTVVFEKFDTTAYTPTNIPVGGSPGGETFGSFYLGNNKFFNSNISSAFTYVNTSGVYGGNIGNNPDDLRGLVFTRFDFNSNLNGTTTCAGSTINIPYINLAFNAGNTFTVQLSDASGSFATPVNIGTISQTGDTVGTMTATIPFGTPAGNLYKLRLVSSNPVMESYRLNQPTINILGGGVAPSIAITGTANDSLTVCGNTNVTLTAISGAGAMTEFLWFKNGVAINSSLVPNYTFNAGNVAGADIYTLKVVYAVDQCLSQTSAPATIIKDIPTATITPAGNTTFCINTPTTLNANAGMTNYVWKRSTTTVQSGASASYIPTQSGNHNVTVTDANGCSKTSAWLNLVAQALPIAQAGADKSLCSGNSVAIGAASNVANSYSWVPTTGLSNPLVSNPSASPLSNTTYTVFVTNISTGCVNSDAMNVSFAAGPAIPSISSTTSPVCEGSTISISPTSSNAASINWYKNGVLQFNKPTNFVQVVSTTSVAADAYTIASKGTNGCLSGLSNVINAWVQPAAIPTITSNPPASGNTVTICNPGGTSGNAILLGNSTTGTPTYSWKLSGNFIPGANQSSFLANVTTSQNNKVYSVQATYANGCVKTSANMTVTLVTSGCTPRLGSDKDDADMVIGEGLDISTYPNPTTGMLNVEIMNSEATNAKLILYNALGQVVMEREITLENGKVSEVLDLSEVAIGVYTLSFQTDKIQKTQKVVKE